MKSFRIIPLLIPLLLLMSCISSPSNRSPQQISSVTEKFKNLLVYMTCYPLDWEIIEPDTLYYLEIEEQLATKDARSRARWTVDWVLTEKDNWVVTQVEEGVYSIEGDGLGYEVQLCHGEWYYYEGNILDGTDSSIQPKSWSSTLLRDLLTLTGIFAPNQNTNGYFPDDDDTYWSVEDIELTWPSSGADTYAIAVSAYGDMRNPIDVEHVSHTYYACPIKLNYDTDYYWQVTAYSGGRIVSRTKILNFTTSTEPVKSKT